MIRFILTFTVTFVLWMLFNLSTELPELLLGFFVALAVAYAARNVIFHKRAGRFLHPVRLGAMLLYVLVFIYMEIWAHADVAYRIITGRIRPALVEVPTQIRRDSGRTLLGNSITLTPGTLTIKVDSKLLVHWLSYRKRGRPGFVFEKLGRMITE